MIELGPTIIPFAQFERETEAMLKVPRFLVTSLDDVEVGDEPVWLVDGLLPASGLAEVFGLPKSGKSFLLTDVLLHVAMGRPWAGRDVVPGAVVYLACEGQAGFRRRLIAMRRHHGIEGQRVPFGVITVAPDLGHADGDAAELIAGIRAWLASEGHPRLAAVVVDTLSRTMKGGDENNTRDMSLFTDNAGLISAALDCLVVAVHHSGKDPSKGSRGSNALDAAVDASWLVEARDGFRTAKIFHMKDGPDDLSWDFRLVPFPLDEGGAPKHLGAPCVVEITREPSSAHPSAPSEKPRLSPDATRFFDIIKEAISEAGEIVRGDGIVPYTQSSITRETLKRYALLRGWVDPEQSANVVRSKISKYSNQLAAKGLIGLSRDHLWIIGGGSNV